MKILYGVQATGNGHITRARIMAKALEQEGITVDWVFSGRHPDAFFDMEAFGSYQSFRGLTFVTREGKVDYLKTLLQSDLWQLWKDIRKMEVSGYDLIISDFEPISAWAAKNNGKKTLGISHQSAFLYPIPKAGDNLLIRLFMRYFAPVNLPVGLHWHHFGQPILPPMVERSHYPVSITSGLCLVYLPFANVRDIIPQLSRFSHYQFHIFHHEHPTDIPSHIHMHSFSRENFQKYLHQCEGVICSAGFELPSEALYLGKKLLVQPVAGQMEQQSNAIALAQAGYAMVSHRLDVATIAQWLDSKQPMPIHFPDVASALAQWIRQTGGQDFEQLVKTLWKPESSPAKQKLMEQRLMTSDGIKQ